MAWGKLGELAAQYLAKGRKVMVVGRLQTQSWEKDGVKRQRTEIVAADVNFLDALGWRRPVERLTHACPQVQPKNRLQNR